MEKEKVYDLIIIGTGPAGLSASLYSSRFLVKHLVIGGIIGGTMNKAHKVENYPGFESLSGMELADKMIEQNKKYGTKIINDQVVKINNNKEKEYFEIFTQQNKESTYKSRFLILATGMEHRSLGIKGEKEFMGKGVSYCSTCDAAFFKDKEVAVVGGGNAATMSSLLLTRYAKKVYLIYRGPKLKGEPTWNKRVAENKKIEVIYNTNITEIKGGATVEKVKLDKPYQKKDFFEVQGVFIEIGYTPSSAIAKHLGIALNKRDFIKVDKEQRTNVKNILAAGDITDKTADFKQIVNSVAEGAMAAKTVFNEKVKQEAREKRTIKYD
ncbi:MAG: hypothetical protein GF347_03740 [Candidatus Moranbacteria bacterium]|nr:hypothetical protein [Candidatus Moranbacteria bacterium]